MLCTTEYGHGGAINMKGGCRRWIGRGDGGGKGAAFSKARYMRATPGNASSNDLPPPSASPPAQWKVLLADGRPAVEGDSPKEWLPAFFKTAPRAHTRGAVHVGRRFRAAVGFGTVSAATGLEAFSVL